MANCELSIGFDLDCKDGVGGVKRIVLAEWYSDFPQEITLDGTEVITALPANADLYTYELQPQKASLEETSSRPDPTRPPIRVMPASRKSLPRS